MFLSLCAGFFFHAGKVTPNSFGRANPEFTAQ
jgi:hypothetical protein